MTDKSRAEFEKWHETLKTPHMTAAERMIVAPERKVMPPDDSNCVKYHYVDGFNECLDQVTLDPMNVDALLPSEGEFSDKFHPIQIGEDHYYPSVPADEVLHFIRAHLKEKLNDK